MKQVEKTKSDGGKEGGIEAIRQDAARLVERIRQYSLAQVEVWRKVPELALEADGRSGYSDNYSRAYVQDVWAVAPPGHRGSYEVYVHLVSGALISACHFAAGKKIVPAPDAEVLRLASRPDVLDAVALVASLEAESRAPYALGYVAAEQEAWRARARTERACKVRAREAVPAPTDRPRIVDPFDLNEVE